MYNAIKINAEKQTFEYVKVENGLQSIYEHIGCTMIEAATYLGTDCIYVDEEGIWNNRGMIAFAFQVSGAHQTFIGNGLVVGTDKQGNSISPNIMIDELKSRVSFLRIPMGRIK